MPSRKPSLQLPGNPFVIISDAIRKATSASEIHFLLTAYVEAARYCDPPGCLPDALRALPIRGTEDLGSRIATLKSAFAAPLDELSERDRAILKETLEIFGAALNRLKYLAEAGRWQVLHDAVC
jgi:hypothetical protein